MNMRQKPQKKTETGYLQITVYGGSRDNYILTKQILVKYKINKDDSNGGS